MLARECRKPYFDAAGASMMPDRAAPSRAMSGYTISWVGIRLSEFTAAAAQSVRARNRPERIWLSHFSSSRVLNRIDVETRLQFGHEGESH
jgi:hypothetical protein